MHLDLPYETVDADFEEHDSTSDAASSDAGGADADVVADVEPSDVHSEDSFDASDLDADGTDDATDLDANNTEETLDADVAGFFPTDSTACLCANPLDRCDGRRCYRDIGRECVGDDACPDGYWCVRSSPRICRPNLPNPSAQYCPGDDFPDRVCPESTVCDRAGVMCVDEVYSCRATHVCAADEICFDCGGDQAAWYAELYGASAAELAELCPIEEPTSFPRCVPVNLVSAMSSWWPTPEEFHCRTSDDCPLGQFCEVGQRRVNESVRGWGFCRFGDSCVGGLIGYVGRSSDGEYAGCYQPGAPCEYATQCAEGFGCLEPPKLERSGSHMCGYYTLLADGTTWLPRPALATEMRPTRDE